MRDSLIRHHVAARAAGLTWIADQFAHVLHRAREGNLEIALPHPPLECLVSLGRKDFAIPRRADGRDLDFKHFPVSSWEAALVVAEESAQPSAALIGGCPTTRTGFLRTHRHALPHHRASRLTI